MTTSAISQFIGSVLAEKVGGIKPSVNRPKVGRPSAYDDTRMDISDRFRPVQDYTDPASYSTSTRDDDPSRPPGGYPYTGSLNVTGMSQSVADQFVGAGRPLSGAMSTVGLGAAMGIGSAASIKNLQRIESNQQAGVVGNAVGMLNGRIIGVSRGPFGRDSYVLSGVLPPGLTHDQRKQIINQLLEMNPTTELVGGKLPTKDNPNPPPPTATPDVVDKIYQGIDPEAAAFEAGFGTQAGYNIATDTSFDFEDRKGGGTPPTAPVTPSASSSSYFGDITPAAPTPTTGNPFTDAIIQGMEGAAGAEVPDPVNDPSATASVTTATDASPPPPPPSSRPPDFVTYTPPQDDSDDDDRPSGTSYSIGSGAPVDAFNERPGLGSSPSPAPSDDSDDDDGGGGKIVCTAMNEAYGFGSFRQAIWLAHSRNMPPEYQAGYHAIFRPLVSYGYGGTTKPRQLVRGVLEGIARRRTADIWMQKKGKRHPVGRIERAFWEPICYVVGKAVLCLKK